MVFGVRKHKPLKNIYQDQPVYVQTKNKYYRGNVVKKGLFNYYLVRHETEKPGTGIWAKKEFIHPRKTENMFDEIARDNKYPLKGEKYSNS